MDVKNRERSRLAGDVELLELLADAEAAGEAGLGVGALAELAGRDKSQVSRALARLAVAGLAERDPVTRRYRVGWSILSLAGRASGGRVVAATREPMRSLSAALGETVHLCVIDGADLITLRSEAPDHGYRATGWVGTRVPAHATSAGRALLLDADPDELGARFGPGPYPAAGPRPRVRDLATLAGAIAEARVHGWAAVDEELAAGVAGVSAPIRDFRGTIVAALNVSAPAERLRPHLADAGERTRAAANDASRALGWSRGSGSSGRGPA